LGTVDRRLGAARHPDAIIGYVRTWSDKRNIPVSLFVRWLGISAGKYHDWEHRFGFAWPG